MPARSQHGWFARSGPLCCAKPNPSTVSAESRKQYTKTNQCKSWARVVLHAAEEATAISGTIDRLHGGEALSELIDVLGGIWDEACHLYLEASQPDDEPAVLQIVDGCPQQALHPHLQQPLQPLKPS